MPMWPTFDAAAHPLGVAEPFCRLDEPARIEAGGVLEKHNRAIRPLQQAPIQLAHHGDQAVGLRRHVPVVMDHQAADPAREAVREFRHRRAASLVQHVDTAIQVHHRQAGMGGHEPQDVIQLVRRVGVHLGGHAHLGEPEPGQLEQRVVPGDALLEERVQDAGRAGPRHGSCQAGLAGVARADVARAWWGMIHEPASASSPSA